MSKTEEFRVVRQHQGDRFYKEGETREGTKADFAHLIPRVLQPIEAKADTAEENKAEPPVANKADTRRESK